MGLREYAEDYAQRDRLSHLRGGGVLLPPGGYHRLGDRRLPRPARSTPRIFIDQVNARRAASASPATPSATTSAGCESNLRRVHGLHGVEVLNGSTPLGGQPHRPALLPGAGAQGHRGQRRPRARNRWASTSPGYPRTVTTLADFVAQLHTLDTRPAIWTGSGYDVVTEF